VTSVPTSTCWPAAGSVLTALPAGTVAFERSETLTVRPSVSSAAWASAAGRSLTSGMVALGGPALTVRATDVPWGTSVPAAGSWVRTVLAGLLSSTVETSPIGYIIGIAILVLVAVGLFFVFQRYGRR